MKRHGPTGGKRGAALEEGRAAKPQVRGAEEVQWNWRKRLHGWKFASRE
jgi:hypothetical protein